MQTQDTIAAISSAVGPSARMIVRLSGPRSGSVVERIGRQSPPPAGGTATRLHLHFANLTCPGWVYFFRSPHSYTGEDSAEFHLPGNPLLAKLLLDDLLHEDARLAQPGEFTARAFFNGKLDLAEAEGVAAVIAAGNASELRAARQLLQGELSRRLQPLMDTLAEIVALVEANIDFAEEQIEFVQHGAVRRRAAEVADALDLLLRECTRIEELALEPRFVLVGRPNAGKSTLVNALSGTARAVVSSTAGTTRDALGVPLDLPHGRVQLVDVAGLDPSARNISRFDLLSDIEQQAQSLALREASTASRLILVRDCSDPEPPPTLARSPDLTVWTKADLPHATTRLAAQEAIVSARTGVGLAALRDHLDDLAFASAGDAPALALTGRHVAAVVDAKTILGRLSAGAPHELALLAHDLREALDALGSIRGVFTPDDILGRIFATFCIGK